jgi:hypothetical protein
MTILLDINMKSQDFIPQPPLWVANNNVANNDILVLCINICFTIYTSVSVMSLYYIVIIYQTLKIEELSRGLLASMGDIIVLSSLHDIISY